MTEHQPREHAVRCPWHNPRHPVFTLNHSGECDACMSAMAAAALVVSSAGIAWSA